jgi:hypothetical protein
MSSSMRRLWLLQRTSFTLATPGSLDHRIAPLRCSTVVIYLHRCHSHGRRHTHAHACEEYAG